MTPGGWLLVVLAFGAGMLVSAQALEVFKFKKRKTINDIEMDDVK